MEDQLTTVIDKIAEKIGVAVSEVGPIAEETLRQFQHRALVMLCALGFLFISGLLIGLAGVHFCNKAVKADSRGDSDINSWGVSVLLFITSGSFLLCTVILFPKYLGQYVAPLPSMLGM